MYNKIARINVYNRTEEEFSQIRSEINKDIKENNVKVYNSDTGMFEEFRGWGNYCLPNIPYDKAVEYADRYNLTVDLERDIIQVEDIQSLEVGQKVQYTVDSMFGMNSYKGTVYAKADNNVTVRLYRSKTKGYVLRVGSVGKIVIGW